MDGGLIPAGGVELMGLGSQTGLVLHPDGHAVAIRVFSPISLISYTPVRISCCVQDYLLVHLLQFLVVHTEIRHVLKLTSTSWSKPSMRCR